MNPYTTQDQMGNSGAICLLDKSYLKFSLTGMVLRPRIVPQIAANIFLKLFFLQFFIILCRILDEFLDNFNWDLL